MIWFSVRFDSMYKSRLLEQKCWYQRYLYGCYKSNKAWFFKEHCRLKSEKKCNSWKQYAELFPSRLKLMLFENNPNGVAPQRLAEWRIFLKKNIDFSLWGNFVTTHTHIIFCPIFSIFRALYAAEITAGGKKSRKRIYAGDGLQSRANIGTTVVSFYRHSRYHI